MPLPPHRHGAWPAVGPSYQAHEGHSTDAAVHGALRHGNLGARHQRSSRPALDRRSRNQPDTEPVKGGRLLCGHPLEASASSTTACTFQTNSDLSMMLHQADRHLIYPPGGKAEVDRKDPLLIEERKEAERRSKRQKEGGRLEQEEVRVLSTIPGLNIALSTPELVDQWLAERKKRWPSDRVVQQKKCASFSGRRPAPFAEPMQRSHASNREQGKRVFAAVEGKEPSPERPRQNRRKETSVISNGERRVSSSERSQSEDSDQDNGSASDAPSEESIKRSGGADGSLSVSAPSARGLPSDLSPELIRSTCHYPLQGQCEHGDTCRQSHAQPSTARKPQAASHIPHPRRPRPRNPVQNPFEPRNLLHALLKQDITQHVHAVAQVIRFLVHNDYLRHVEHQPGLAELQREKRSMIQEVNLMNNSSHFPSPLACLHQISHPIHDGGLPVVTDVSTSSTVVRPGRSLYKPASPLLRPLKELAWPPEPDPMLFLDPLRKNDPKPLTNKQFELLATDQELRNIIAPATDQHPHGEPRPAFERALQTLEDLPSDDHRRSALELILGVSAQTPQHSHQLGPTFVQSRPGESRFIGEVELFKLGLRCGPAEQILFQKLAQRISEVTEGPEFDVEPLGWDLQREEGLSFREEKRLRYYEKEADRRDVLRKLGIEVD